MDPLLEAWGALPDWVQESVPEDASLAYRIAVVASQCEFYRKGWDACRQQHKSLKESLRDVC